MLRSSWKERVSFPSLSLSMHTTTTSIEFQSSNPTKMFLATAARPLAATIGRRAFARSFATVGSQIPDVELHSEFGRNISCIVLVSLKHSCDDTQQLNINCVELFHLLLQLCLHVGRIIHTHLQHNMAMPI